MVQFHEDVLTRFDAERRKVRLELAGHHEDGEELHSRPPSEAGSEYADAESHRTD